MGELVVVGWSGGPHSAPLFPASSLISVTICSFVIFSAAFGGAYGFVTGSRSDRYDPNNFAIGEVFRSAIACLALATVSMRLRFLRKRLRKLALHNEAMAINRELQEAEGRARSLFELQSDLIVLRDGDGRITFVNEAYCELARKERPELIGSRFQFTVLEQGESAIEFRQRHTDL